MLVNEDWEFVVVTLPPPQADSRAVMATSAENVKTLAGILNALNRFAVTNAVRLSEISKSVGGKPPFNGGMSAPDVGLGCEVECGVVAMFSVTVVAVDPLTEMELDGEKVHVASVGSPPVQASATVPLKPATPERFSW